MGVALDWGRSVNELPVTTSATAGAVVIMQTVHQFTTSVSRGKHVRGLGDGGHKPLEIATRRRGNPVENVPILLIVLLLMDIAALARGWLLAFAAPAVVGRISHAIGVTVSPDRPHPSRFFGAMSSVMIGLAGGVWLLTRALSHA